jgi:hypothetical protein
MSFNLRFSLLLILVSSLVGCASATRVACSGFGDLNLAEDEVAVLHFLTASLEAIDGNTVPLGRDPEMFTCSEARLYPGLHTLTLRTEVPSRENDEITDYIKLIHNLSFRAKPGHIYDLHFENTQRRDVGFSWWIEDAMTNEIVAGMSAE